MERDYSLNGYETTFGKFADKVMREFKLIGEGVRFPSYRISACVDMPALYLSRLEEIGRQRTNKEVSVILRLNYGKKYLTFTHPFTFEQLEDKLDDWGRVEDAQDLVVRPEMLKLKIGHFKTDYNYGRQANGQEFDGDNFVKKIFKKCQKDSQMFTPRCVVDNISKDQGKGGK